MISWNIYEAKFLKDSSKWNSSLKRKPEICKCIKVSIGWVLGPISEITFEFGACTSGGNRPTSNAHPETFRKIFGQKFSVPVPDNFFFFWDWDRKILVDFFSKRLGVSIWRWAVASGGTCTKLKSHFWRLAPKLSLWISWYTYIFQVFASSWKNVLSNPSKTKSDVCFIKNSTRERVCVWMGKI